MVESRLWGNTATKQRTAGNNEAALPALLLCSKNRCVSLFDPLWVTAECFLLTQLQKIWFNSVVFLHHWQS